MNLLVKSLKPDFSFTSMLEDLSDFNDYMKRLIDYYNLNDQMRKPKFLPDAISVTFGKDSYKIISYGNLDTENATKVLELIDYMKHTYHANSIYDYLSVCFYEETENFCSSLEVSLV